MAEDHNCATPMPTISPTSTPAAATSSPALAPTATAGPPTPAPPSPSAPAYAPTLPPGFPDLSQSIMPTPESTRTASALAAPGPPGAPGLLALPPGFPDLAQTILPTPAPAPSTSPSSGLQANAPAAAMTPTEPTPSPSLPPAVAALPSASPRVVASEPAAPVGPSATPGPNDAVPPLYVKGQILTISAGFVIFTSGDSLRLASGVVIPAGVTTGSYVRASVDQLARLVTAIELEPHTNLPGEVDAANIPRQYVVISPKSAPLPAATGQAGASGNAQVTITIVVHVPGNTPTSDDVYLATERSQYSPAEVRMDRIDGSTWSTTVSLANGTALKYEFTRGTYTTVERDRTGGIVSPHVASGTQNLKTDDTVIRWADLS